MSFLKVLRLLAVAELALFLGLSHPVAQTYPGDVTYRPQLTANKQFWVNGNSGGSAACGPIGAQTCSAGSDSNNCLTPATACLTLQHAVNVVLSGYDNAGFISTIQLAHGSSTNYGGALCNAAVVGKVTIFIQGDTTSPTATTIVAPNGTYGVYALDYCGLRLDSVTVGDQGTAAQGVRIGQFGVIDFNNIHCAAFNTSAQCIYIEKSGAANFVASPGITIDGCGQNFLRMAGGTFNPAGVSPPVTGNTIAIPSAISCADALVNATGPANLTNFSNGTFTGAGVAGTTGVRAKLVGPIFLQGGGSACNSIFPGNSNCQITQGAQDDAGDPQTSPLSIANGGTGIATGGARLTSPATSVNFGVAGDYAISIPLPSGYTQACSIQIIISGASGNLTTATFGVNTATGGGGTALIAAGTAPSVTTGAASTNNNLEQINVSNITTQAYTPVAGAFQFRVGTTVAQTANVQATYTACP